MGIARLKLLQDLKHRAPRLWSNDVLRQIAPAFTGSVINVSGWRDEDKQGGHYRDYFSSAASYSISNMGGYRGESPDTAYMLDLEANLPLELERRFDVVFNHTTLEHVFDVFSAVRNLCAMTRDVVIVVVPFMQEQHAHDDFSDYWRFTPLGIKALFRAHGLETVLLCSTPGHRSAIYHLAVASRHPAEWSGRFDALSVNENTGRDFFNNPLRDLLRRIAGRSTT